MSTDLYSEAYQFCRDMATEHETAIVSLSGGKDSLAVLDIACQTFKNVVPFHLYLVRGLRFVEDVLDDCEKRYNLRVQYYPHTIGMSANYSGIYCDIGSNAAPDLPIEYKDLVASIQHILGGHPVLTGCRRSDSHQRRLLMDRGLMPGLHPIANWTKQTVTAFLSRRGIKAPPSMPGRTTGASLAIDDLLWMYDNHPEDFATLAESYPYIHAAVWRRKFYGFGGKNDYKPFKGARRLKGKTDG